MTLCKRDCRLMLSALFRFRGKKRWKWGWKFSSIPRRQRKLFDRGNTTPSASLILALLVSFLSIHCCHPVSTWALNLVAPLSCSRAIHFRIPKEHMTQCLPISVITLTTNCIDCSVSEFPVSEHETRRLLRTWIHPDVKRWNFTIQKTIISRLFKPSSQLAEPFTFFLFLRVGVERGHAGMFPFFFRAHGLCHHQFHTWFGYKLFLISYLIHSFLPQGFSHLDVSEHIFFDIKFSYVDADELGVLFLFLSLCMRHSSFFIRGRGEMFEFTIKIHVNANWHKIYSRSTSLGGLSELVRVFFSGRFRWWCWRIDFILIGGREVEIYFAISIIKGICLSICIEKIHDLRLKIHEQDFELILRIVSSRFESPKL